DPSRVRRGSRSWPGRRRRPRGGVTFCPPRRRVGSAGHEPTAEGDGGSEETPVTPWPGLQPVGSEGEIDGMRAWSRELLMALAQQVGNAEVSMLPGPDGTVQVEMRVDSAVVSTGALG